MAIVECGSYTKAAEALHVSQPSLSQQIKQLEESLQSPLLVRTGRAVRLTDVGEVYLHHAKRAYGELDAGTRAIHDVQDLSRGSLCLGWTPITDYLACSLLERFSRLYPGIMLNTLEMSADNIEIAVTEDRIDIGIAFSPVTLATPRVSGIEVRQLFKESLCFAVGNSHLCAGQKERMSVQEFNKESLVLLNSNFALRRQINTYCTEQGIMPRIAIETDSLSVIIEMVQHSPYGTVLPKSIIQAQCGIYPIVLAPAVPAQAVTLITRNHGYSSAASIAFSRLAMDWAVDQITSLRNDKSGYCPLSGSHRCSKKQLS